MLGRFSAENVTTDNAGYYTVHGLVDSQNSFGAMEHATFDCVTRYTSAATTTKVTVTVDK